MRDDSTLLGIAADVAGIAADVAVSDTGARLDNLERQLKRVAVALELVSEGLMNLNLHVGADASPWARRDPKWVDVGPDLVRYAGTVKWYDDIEGHGFIRPVLGGDDVFVHQSGVFTPTSILVSGQPVEFHVVDGPRAPLAVNVVLREDEAPQV